MGTLALTAGRTRDAVDGSGNAVVNWRF
jgi:antitoxin FitA